MSDVVTTYSQRYMHVTRKGWYTNPMNLYIRLRDLKVEWHGLDVRAHSFFFADFQPLHNGPIVQVRIDDE